MLLKCSVDTFELSIAKDSNLNRDYDFFGDEKIEVFVYGYPYSIQRGSFLTAHEVHKMYIKNTRTTSFMDDIDGVYGIIILEKDAHKSLVIVDPFKIYTFYIYKGIDEILISDQMKDITGFIETVSLNHGGIKELINFGFMLGNKTMFNEISTVSPGTNLCIQNDLKIEEAPYCRYQKTNNNYTNQDYLEAFNENVALGIKLGEKISLPLTGGLDSRTILSACYKDSLKVHCYTHGLSNSDDVRIALKICKTLDIKHNHYGKLDESFVNSIPEVAESLSEVHQGMINSVLFSHIKNSYEKEAKVSDTFFTGVGGELVRLYYLPKNYNELNFKEFATELRKKLQLRPSFDVFLDSDLANTLDDLVLQEIQKYDSDDKVYIAERFLLENNIGNFGAYNIRVIGKYMNVFNPFLSKKILNVISAINNESKVGYEVQRYIIDSNCPDLLKIPLDRGRDLNNSRYHSIVSYFKYGLFRAKKEVNSILKKNLFNISFVDYNTWLTKYHKEYVQSILTSTNILNEGIIEEDKLNDKLREFSQGDGRAFYQMTNLLSLVMFLNRINMKKS